jgi:nicotinate-nucleotide pyrophosphorylase (carboxylating)
MARDEILTRVIGLALEEDVGGGDWTTLWTVEPHAVGEALIVAKEELVVAGTDVASRAFLMVDPALTVTVLASCGRWVEQGEAVVRVEGSLRGILTGERTALNFLGRLSGVATLTRRFVEAVAGTDARILDTRKTTPGLRILEKEAVRAGGGENHRLGLHDMALIKENHILAAGGVTAAVEGVRRGNERGIPVEVEVSTLKELDELLSLPPQGIQRVLLDNMSLGEMAEAVGRVHESVHGPGGRGIPLLVEASGNITLDNVRAVAETGVDLISVGALTHSSPGADLSLIVVGR